jgi:hypothetical protein
MQFMSFNKIKGFIENKFEKLGFGKENILPFLISVGISIMFFLDSRYLNNTLLLILWIVDTIIIGFLVSWVFVKAGFAVLESLFYVGAEISLLIFLADSYCKTGMTSLKGNDALKVIIVTSIIFIGYKFYLSLKKSLKEKLDDLNSKEKKWAWEKIIIVGLFVVFAALFICLIYRVVSPIMGSLCIYKK